MAPQEPTKVDPNEMLPHLQRLCTLRVSTRPLTLRPYVHRIGSRPRGGWATFGTDGRVLGAVRGKANGVPSTASLNLDSDTALRLDETIGRSASPLGRLPMARLRAWAGPPVRADEEDVRLGVIEGIGCDRLLLAHGLAGFDAETVEVGRLQLATGRALVFQASQGWRLVLMEMLIMSDICEGWDEAPRLELETTAAA